MIKSGEDLRAWLEGKPVEWARAIAVRAALRSFPAVFNALSLSNERLTPVQKQVLFLQSFRRTFISWVALKYPTQGIASSAAHAVFAEDVFFAAGDNSNPARAAAAAARAAAAAADAVARAEATHAAQAHTAVARAAAASAAAVRAAAARTPAATDADATAAKAETWAAISADCAWLETGSSEGGSLIERPLWPNNVRGDLKYKTNLPPRARGLLDTFAESKTARETSWKLIVDWYRTILPNRPPLDRSQSLFDESANIAIATQPDEFWKVTKFRSAEMIMDEVAAIAGQEGRQRTEINTERENRPTIAQFILDFLAQKGTPARNQEILDEFRNKNHPVLAKTVRGELSRLASRGQITRLEPGLYTIGETNERGPDWANPLLDFENQPYGFTFEERNGQLAIAASGTESDADAASDKITRQLHPEVAKRAGAFLEVGSRLDNQPGWRGIAPPASRLAATLNGGPEAVAEHVVEVWSDIVELGSFLEQDTRVRGASDSFIDPLEPDVRRRLENLITIASPYVRRYPTAATLDVESAAFQTGENKTADAKAIVIGAKRTGLLNHRDAGVLLDVLDAAERPSVQAGKARTMGVQSSRNIVGQAAKFIVASYVGAVLSAAAPQSLLLRPAVEFYLRTETHILLLAEGMPADLNIAYRILLDKLKETPLPQVPRQVREDGTRGRPRKDREEEQ